MKRFLRWLLGLVVILIAIGITITLAIEPYEVPARPLVQQPELTDGAFVMSDGSRLPFLAWQPASGAPSSVVIGIHGGGHHSTTMIPLGQFLSEREIATYAYDLRGHGSAPDYGKWPGAETINRDLADIVTLLRSRHPRTPIFVAGLSFGGAVAINALGSDASPEVEGAILISPMLGRSQLSYRLLSAALGVVARLLPEATIPAPAAEGMSDGEEYLALEKSDPLIMESMEFQYVYGGISYAEQTTDAATALDMPVLVQFGYHDGNISEASMQAFGSSIPGPTRLVGYPNGYHVLIWDEQREVVLTDIAAWISNHDAPLPSANMQPLLSVELQTE